MECNRGQKASGPLCQCPFNVPLEDVPKGGSASILTYIVSILISMLKISGASGDTVVVMGNQEKSYKKYITKSNSHIVSSLECLCSSLI